MAQLKEIVDVIAIDPPPHSEKIGTVRFTMVNYKPLTDQQWGRLRQFQSKTWRILTIFLYFYKENRDITFILDQTKGLKGTCANQTCHSINVCSLEIKSTVPFIRKYSFYTMLYVSLISISERLNPESLDGTDISSGSSGRGRFCAGREGEELRAGRAGRRTRAGRTWRRPGSELRELFLELGLSFFFQSRLDRLESLRGLLVKFLDRILS